MPGDISQTTTVPGGILLHFAGQSRAWADKAHIAPEHVPELGQLVQLVRRKKRPMRVQRGSLRILKRGPEASFWVRKASTCASASVRMERNFHTVNSTPLRPTRVSPNHGTRGIQPDGDGDDHQQRRAQHQHQACPAAIHRSLEKDLPILQFRFAEAQQGHAVQGLHHHLPRAIWNRSGTMRTATLSRWHWFMMVRILR